MKKEYLIGKNNIKMKCFYHETYENNKCFSARHIQSVFSAAAEMDS